MILNCMTNIKSIKKPFFFFKNTFFTPGVGDGIKKYTITYRLTCVFDARTLFTISRNSFVRNKVDT